MKRNKEELNKLRVQNLENAIGELSPQYPDTDGVTGRLTFAGALRKFIAETDEKGNIIGVGRGWDRNADGTTTTAIDNIDIYNKRILPNLPDPYKALADYTAEDFLRPIDIITQEGYRKGGEDNNHIDYADSTIDGYRRLIHRVFERAYENGIIQRDVLVGTSLKELKISNAEIEQEKKKLRKSFTPMEEFAIFDKLLASIQSKYRIATGQTFGLFLMCFMGLRPQEIASLVFGDLRRLKTIMDRYVFEVLSANKPGSRKRIGGGKTFNAPRLQVAFDMLAVLILDRKERIKQLLDNKNVHIDIDSLPVACKDNCYELACTPEDISVAGRELLLSLDFPARRMAVIEEILRRDANSGEAQFLIMGVEERHPTTYLLRRNVATRLHLSGLTEAQIQYLMGHKIEQDYVLRSDFTNEDMLKDIIRKAERHPIYQYIIDGEVKVSYPAFDSYIISSAPASLNINDSSYIKLEFPISSKERTVQLIIDETEPYDDVKMIIQDSDAIRGTLTKTPLDKNYPRHVNNLRTMYQVYYKAFLLYRKIKRFSFR